MIGQTISHYKILEELGCGGMGVVYKAEDLKLRRTVALKFLTPELTRETSAKSRFIHEAQAASALQHHNICTIHEIGESKDGRLFISMDCYEGETLKEKAESGPLSTEEALRLTIETATGLAKAHESGMVHRDIKPANLMVTQDGVVKILDFGLAKLAGQTKVTKTGTTLGTVAYMSPEQARGKEVDQRSDVWSLGVVLYELLAGEVPFKGDHEGAVLYGIMHSDPKTLSELRDDLPEELVWITDKALAKDPDERYQSSSEFLNDLLAVYKPLQSESDTAPVLRAQPRKRRKRLELLHPAVLGGVVVIAVLLVVVLKFWSGRDQPSSPSLVWETPPLVVVSPFENKTGDFSLDNVAALTSEVLARDLAGLDLVETLPFPGSAEAGQAADSGGDEIHAGEAVADADIIVSGAFYLEGEDLQFQARVSEAKSGKLISTLPMISGSPEAPRKAIEQVSQRVLGALAMRLDNPFRQPLPAHPPTYEAFIEYRLGRDGFDAQIGLGPLRKAIQNMEKAVALDSTFMRPHIFLPSLYFSLGAWGRAQADTIVRDLDAMRSRMDEYERLALDMFKEGIAGNFQAALGVAERLERIAPQDQLVKSTMLGYLDKLNQPRRFLEVYNELNMTEDQERRLYFALKTRDAADAYHDLGLYEEELRLRKRMIEFYPNHVLLRLDEAYPHAAMGNVEEVRRVLRECQSIPGGRGYIDWSLWTACDQLRVHGNREAAIAIINDYIEERVERPGDEDRIHLKKGNLARLLYGAERWEDARVACQEALVIEPDNIGYQLFLGKIAARLGDQETAQRVETEFLDVPAEPYSYGWQSMERARFAAIQGELDRAVLLLREAAAQGSWLPCGHVHDIDLLPLQGYPPFEELIRPKG